jgi:hypothetical protein
VTGAVVALALQTVLLVLGLAVATSFGDHQPGGGFSLWAIIVELVAVGFGAMVSARLAHADDRQRGIAAGLMLWAVMIVIGSWFQGLTLARGFTGGAAWTLFIAAILSLAAAVYGGLLGAGFHGSPRDTVTRDRDDLSRDQAAMSRLG